MRQTICRIPCISKAAKHVGKHHAPFLEKVVKHPSSNERKKQHFPSANLQFNQVDKIFWPEESYTKADLLTYYQDVASFILPYLRDRPEIFHRHPSGIEGPSYYQKEVDQKLPSWIETAIVKSGKENGNYVVIQNEASLLYQINLGCIEITPFSSRLRSLDKPDYLVFDLDAENISFEKVIETAQVIHEILDEAGAMSFCKTSGTTGLHVYIPLGSLYSYAQAKEFAKLIAYLAHERLPKFTSIEKASSKRIKKVLIDYTLNVRGQTIVCPYSLRAQPGAPVSTPLKWSEVKSGLNPSQYTIKTIFRRLKKMGDIFSPVLSLNVDLAKSLKSLEKQS